jgi:rRNA maturation endonuclease Nob1
MFSFSTGTEPNNFEKRIALIELDLYKEIIVYEEKPVRVKVPANYWSRCCQCKTKNDLTQRVTCKKCGERLPDEDLYV